MNGTVEIGRIDRRILRELQRDGRLSNAALAERVGVSESACRRHRHRLEDAGFIKGYAAIIDAQRLGYAENVFVVIGLSTQSRHELTAFETSLGEMDEVMEWHSLAGDEDYLVRVVARDRHDYMRIQRRLTELPNVAHVHSYFTLRDEVAHTEVPL